MTHKTKGIVLRAVKYGETSIIATVYTELFGIQSYIVKGVRQSSKKSQGKSNYFQPSAILQMEVYHNELKNLQFIKEFEWAYLYEHLFFDVIKNAVATYMVELLQHSLKQPEANPELFYLMEDSLKQLDRGDVTLTANLPLYFTLHLATELGFQWQGEFNKHTPVLDLEEGQYVGDIPGHPFYLSGELARISSEINSINFYNDLENIQLNRTVRRQLLQSFQQYIALHVSDFGELRSLSVLYELF
ncbi:DNA repair protein RecO [Danxiaibacter flavus]|uniref:DNA repair protein RecO n=1 Tax=Danxiaibacter flavus TaxID=3049108 RepID=A0ABV3ZKN5_9BACT|nr:DNA repair protein RecO [Chitinophagaceae bacterium DXS]